MDILEDKKIKTLDTHQTRQLSFNKIMLKIFLIVYFLWFWFLVVFNSASNFYFQSMRYRII